MANRRVDKIISLAGSSQDIFDSPVIPNGKKLRIIRFGASEENVGDNKSSTFLIRWGTVGSFQDIRLFALTGNTIDITINREITGDGAKFIRVISKNNSALPKNVSWWLEAYD